jgi:ribokinase
MPTITVTGSLNMDLVVRTPRAPQAGETLTGTDFHLIPGGKGANQAVAAARTGAPTRLLGCVGMDAFGPVLLESLGAAGVEVSGVRRLEDISTGTATIIVEECGENRILIVPGANGQVTSQLIEQAWPSIRQAGMILLQHEIPLPTVHFIIERAHHEGIPVLLNPAPIYPIPPALLPQIDILVLNEIEATALAGLQVSDTKTATQAARSLTGRGVRTVILTLGAAGAVLVNGTYEMHQPAYKVQAVDTTAAGDTFVGSYAASILSGEQPAAALRYAAAAAALSVTRLGAQTSIPMREEVEAFITAYERDNPLFPPNFQKGDV